MAEKGAERTNDVSALTGRQSLSLMFPGFRERLEQFGQGRNKPRPSLHQFLHQRLSEQRQGKRGVEALAAGG